MNVDTNAILALPVADKLQLVELLWDNIGEYNKEIPLPKWVDQEALRRREEMLADPTLGNNHQETWAKIANRNG